MGWGGTVGEQGLLTELCQFLSVCDLWTKESLVLSASAQELRNSREREAVSGCYQHPRPFYMDAVVVLHSRNTVGEVGEELGQRDLS